MTALRISGDKRLASYCAEYLVATRLSKTGHDVEVTQKMRGTDIYLKDMGKYVEVKSGRKNLSDWGCRASFGKGTSIKNRKFDYCVWVIFNALEPDELLFFTIEELQELAEKPRPYPITAFPNNPCVLFRYNNLEEYERSMKGHTLDIELELHRDPERFRDRWDKIQ